MSLITCSHHSPMVTTPAASLSFTRLFRFATACRASWEKSCEDASVTKVTRSTFNCHPLTHLPNFTLFFNFSIPKILLQAASRHV